MIKTLFSSSHLFCKIQDAGIYVGFANLPNQVHRKSVKRGFEFTLMVIGESGLGKCEIERSVYIYLF